MTANRIIDFDFCRVTERIARLKKFIILPILLIHHSLQVPLKMKHFNHSILSNTSNIDITHYCSMCTIICSTNAFVNDKLGISKKIYLNTRRD